MSMKREREARRQEAITNLLNRIKPGDTINTMCRNKQGTQHSVFIVANISYNGRVWSIDVCVYDPYIEDPIKRQLAGEYAWLIGYDPFKDDPNISIDEVRKTLADYKRERERA